MAKVVVEGAKVRCNQSLGQMVELKVTSQHIVTIEGKKVATIADVQPIGNVPFFKQCAFLTELASGIPQGCKFMPLGLWRNGSRIRKIDGLAVLVEHAECTCATFIGGALEITVPGQKFVDLNEQVPAGGAEQSPSLMD